MAVTSERSTRFWVIAGLVGFALIGFVVGAAVVVRAPVNKGQTVPPMDAKFVNVPRGTFWMGWDAPTTSKW